MLPEIERVFDADYKAYGKRKVWRQMRRDGFDVARSTAARLTKSLGIQGIIRGKLHRKTILDEATPCPLDTVNRQFRVPTPDLLWVRDFICVASWTSVRRGARTDGSSMLNSTSPS